MFTRNLSRRLQKRRTKLPRASAARPSPKTPNTRRNRAPNPTSSFGKKMEFGRNSTYDFLTADKRNISNATVAGPDGSRRGVQNAAKRRTRCGRHRREGRVADQRLDGERKDLADAAREEHARERGRQRRKVTDDFSIYQTNTSTSNYSSLSSHRHFISTSHLLGPHLLHVTTISLFVFLGSCWGLTKSCVHLHYPRSLGYHRTKRIKL